MLAAIPYKSFPEIDLGFVNLHTFGLLVGLGVLLGVYLSAQHLDRAAGIDRDTSYRFGFWLVVIGFIGARLTYVFTNWDDLDSPLDALAVWKGGLQFAGGFLGGIVFAILWLRVNDHIPRWPVLDSVAVGLTAGLAIGRMGCYSVGEHLGGPTSFFLGTRIESLNLREGCHLGRGPCIQIGDVIHNTALYEILHLAVLFGLLLYLRHRTKVGPGALFAVFLGWYSVARFSTDFLRAYDRTRLGLTGAQWMMIGVAIGAVAISWRLVTKKEPRQDIASVVEPVLDDELPVV